MGLPKAHWNRFFQFSEKPSSGISTTKTLPKRNMTMENRCISYWKCGFSNVVLALPGVYFSISPLLEAQMLPIFLPALEAQSLTKALLETSLYVRLCLSVEQNKTLLYKQPKIVQPITTHTPFMYGIFTYIWLIFMVNVDKMWVNIPMYMDFMGHDMPCKESRDEKRHILDLFLHLMKKLGKKISLDFEVVVCFEKGFVSRLQ